MVVLIGFAHGLIVGLGMGATGSSGGGLGGSGGVFGVAASGLGKQSTVSDDLKTGGEHTLLGWLLLAP